MSDSNNLPIAGWYPDPENEAGDRWWNGSSWSDHRRPRGAGSGWAPVSAEPGSAATGSAAPEPAVPPIPVPTVAVPNQAVEPANPNPYASSGQNPSAGPYAASYPTPYASNYSPKPPNANGLALAGMITSLAGLLLIFILAGIPGIVGGIISCIGLAKANRLIRSGVTTGHGRGFAITGIIVGFVQALLLLLFVWAAIAVWSTQPRY